MSYLKPQVSFSLNFASLFSVIRDNSSLFFFSWNFIWFGQVWQCKNSETFDCSHEISPTLCFQRLVLLEVYKISAKKVQRSYILWHWRVMQNLKKNRFVILIRALRSLKNLHFDWSLFAKYITFDLKKYRGIIFHDTKVSFKIWKKNWLVAWKMTWGILKTFTRTFGSVKIGTMIGSFCPM